MRCFWSMHSLHKERSLRKRNNSQELRHIFLNFSSAHCHCSCDEDLANQVRHWETYVAEIRKNNVSPGCFLHPSAAEWFSGSPCMLELNVNNPLISIIHVCQVCRLDGLFRMQVPFLLPKSMLCSRSMRLENEVCLASNCGIDSQSQCQAVKREKCISLFSGVGGLEVGMRQWRRLELVLSLQKYVNVELVVPFMAPTEVAAAFLVNLTVQGQHA